MKKRRIFARYPVPSKEEFGDGLEKHAKFFGMTVDQYLDRYIKSRFGDIKESEEKILREQERIKKAKKCIKIVSSFKSDKNSKN